jgi:hypothetical protein
MFIVATINVCMKVWYVVLRSGIDSPTLPIQIVVKNNRIALTVDSRV